MQNRLPPRKTSKQNLHMLWQEIEGIIDEEAEHHLNHKTGRVEMHNTDIIELKHHISQAFSNYDKLISPPIRMPEDILGYTADGLLIDDDIPF